MSTEMTQERGMPRTLVGEVVSNKMDKTIVVKVARRFKHPTYKKYVTRTKKYMAHDERNEANIGDQVLIVESRPLSARKRWRLRTIERRAVVLDNA